MYEEGVCADVHLHSFVHTHTHQTYMHVHMSPCTYAHFDDMMAFFSHEVHSRVFFVSDFYMEQKFLPCLPCTPHQLRLEARILILWKRIHLSICVGKICKPRWRDVYARTNAITTRADRHVFFIYLADVADCLHAQDVRYNGFDRSDPSVDWEKMEQQLISSKLEYQGDEGLRFLGWPDDE